MILNLVQHLRRNCFWKRFVLSFIRCNTNGYVLFDKKCLNSLWQESQQYIEHSVYGAASPETETGAGEWDEGRVREEQGRAQPAARERVTGRAWGQSNSTTTWG